MKRVTTISVKVSSYVVPREITVVIAEDQLNNYWLMMQKLGAVLFILTANLIDGTVVPVVPFTKWNDALQAHEFLRLEDSSGTTWWSSDQDA